ncbi:MAG: hypothetical protein U0175_27940 [Caldilineaceae bacterium]
MQNFRFKMRWFMLFTVLAASLLVIAPAQSVNAQTPDTVAATVGSAFNYQGRLNDNNNPANGNYDFQFILYDAASGGSQRGSTLKKDKVAVSNGLFNLPLDFGQAVFDGTALFLEVGVKPAGSLGAYTILSPRTAINAVPYAVGIPTVTSQGARTIVNNGELQLTGIQFIMGPNGNGDGGRALVLDSGDRLILNWGNDFAGGTEVGSKMTIHGNASVVGDITVFGAIKSQENKPAFFVTILEEGCGYEHPYLGCPAGFVNVGQWHVGDSCDGAIRGVGYENGQLSTGWLAMCAAG